MTLPDNCDLCGYPMTPWDPNKDTPCANPACGVTVKTWEHLTPEEARRRMRLQARRQRITDAPEIPVKDDLL